MPYTKRRRTRITPHRFYQKQSPFIVSYHSIANERHPSRNEDSILVDPVGGLYAVFDGVGGSAAAEIASQTAAQSATHVWKRLLTRVLHSHRRKIYTTLEDREQWDLCKRLQELVLQSDEQVRTDGARRAGTDDLATTVALVALCRQTDSNSFSMVYAHVGDSRVYLLREHETIKRLTNDDGLLTKLIESQVLDEQHAMHIDQAMRADQLSDMEYNYFRFRGGITQALGGPIPPTIHADKITICPGDRILLCTDGIHDNLTDDEITDILRTTPRTTTARTLVERARERSREDRNHTIRSKPDDMSAIVMTYRF
ncbi:MAG TPA: PP2C family serine/threonine-protein phosphatase [Dictyobacter sp.]|nr:PP2C family serine/threonine-protein phosphatase [Dictyobacter sp.]